MKQSLLRGAGGLVLAVSVFSSPYVLLAGPKSEAPYRLQAAQPIGDGYLDRDGTSAALSPEIDRPLSLASADLDADGVPDLIAGYGSSSGGTLTIHRGNVVSIMSPPRLAGVPGPAPFLTPGTILNLPVRPVFLGAGDFDADGHWDVVVASDDEAALYLMTGNGRGELDRARRIDLPGTVTALAIGDVNRRDGLDDILVGIDGGSTSAMLVFEGPRGALSHEPEIHLLPDAPTSFAIGQLDPDMLVDFAAGAASDVWIVEGRDRKLSLDSLRRSAVGPAHVERFSFDSTVRGVAIADFVTEEGGYLEEVAVLDGSGSLHLVGFGAAAAGSSARSILGTRAVATPGSSLALANARVTGSGEELIVLDRDAGRLSLFTAGARDAVDGLTAIRAGQTAELGSAPLALLSMRLNGDALADLVTLRPDATEPYVTESSVLAIFTVVNTNDNGNGTIRRAVQSANNNAGPDLIVFDIPFLCSLAGTVCLLDVDCPAGETCLNTNINIDLGAGLDLITDTVTIDGYTQPGAALNTVAAPGITNAVVQIGFDGTNATFFDGLVLNAGSCSIRGLAIKDWNLNGMTIASAGNIIEGNYVGTAISGLTTDDNEDDGIQIVNAANNRIGGTAPFQRNLISANFDDGLDITGAGSVGNIIEGNFIGLNAHGNGPLGNVSDGIENDSPGNTVGGTSPGAANVIADNVGDGIDMSSTGNIVQANRIGTDAAGVTLIANGARGINVTGSNQTLGGTSAAASNVVSGNSLGGVIAKGLGPGIMIQGNYIGTDVTGSFGLANNLYGIEIRSPGMTVGGTASGSGNVISANSGPGVSIVTNATGNANNAVVQGNVIGLDATGVAPIPNSSGVTIVNSSNIAIGGVDFGAGNLISSNQGGGVEILGGSGNTVEANLIGTDAGGLLARGNQLDGVYIFDSSLNTVGGISFAAPNLIASNGRSGIVVSGVATRNRLLGNYILDNGLRGIDLGDNGPTLNDVGDGDVGPNDLQNFPTLTSAILTPTAQLTLSGTLESTPQTTFRVEFFNSAICDPSGFGEGESLFHSINVATDATGSVALNEVFNGLSFVPGQITATATNPLGSTSEFSLCAPATCTSIDAFGATLVGLNESLMGWGVSRAVSFARGDIADLDSSYQTFDSGSLFGTATMQIGGDVAAPFQTFWYLVRPAFCGSWQDPAGSAPERDTALP